MGSAIERFKQEGRMELLYELVKDNIVSLADAARRLEISEDEFRKTYQEYLSDENEEH